MRETTKETTKEPIKIYIVILFLTLGFLLITIGVAGLLLCLSKDPVLTIGIIMGLILGLYIISTCRTIYINKKKYKSI